MISDNTKFRLTIGQVKELVRESMEKPLFPIEEEMLNALAKGLGVNVSELTVHGSLYSNSITVTDADRNEYLVFAGYNYAEYAAIENTQEILEDTGIEGINFDYIGGIEDFVDVSWFKMACEEMDQNYLDDIKSEEGRFEEEFPGMTDDEALEKLRENWETDPVQYFIDEFGEKEFENIVNNNRLFNNAKLAEAIVNADGVANSLATYDGKEIPLENDFWAYRTN